MHAKAPSALAVTSARPDPANRPVRTLLRGAPVICTPETTIREAALQMSEHGASAIVVKLGETLGSSRTATCARASCGGPFLRRAVSAP